jgi:hypothetical protein
MGQGDANVGVAFGWEAVEETWWFNGDIVRGRIEASKQCNRGNNGMDCVATGVGEGGFECLQQAKKWSP